MLTEVINSSKFKFFHEKGAINSSLQFFKTYYLGYGFNKPERNKLMQFDMLTENKDTSEQQLNDYYKNLADKIYEAVKNKFRKS